jgi:hypothetical protein
VQLLSEMHVVHRRALPDASRNAVWLGNSIIAGCDDGSLVAINAGGELHHLHRFDSPITALATGPNAISVGTLGGDTQVRSSSGVATRRPDETAVLATTFAGPHPVFIAGTSLVVDCGTAHDTMVPLDVGPLTALATVQGSLIVAGGVHGVVWYDVAMLASDGCIVLPTIVAISADPLRRFVAAGDLGGSLHVLRPGRDDALELTGYPDRVAPLTWLASGAGLCATADDELTVWPATDNGFDESEPQRLTAHEHPITALCASPTDDLMVSGDANGAVLMWSPMRVDVPIARLRTDSTILAIAWHHTGRYFAISTSAGEFVRCAVTVGEIA